MFSELFVYKIIFIIEIFVAMNVFAFQQKKKSLPVLRYILSFLSVVIVAILFPIIDGISYSWWYSSLMFFTLFFVCFLTMFIIYDVSWQKIFFISVTAYTIQHLSHEVYSILANLLALDGLSSSLGVYGDGAFNFSTHSFTFVVSLATFIVVYTVCFFLIYKRINNFHLQVDNVFILFISFLILFVDVIFNSFVIYQGDDLTQTVSLIICGYNIICCLMVFFIQFIVISKKQVENDLEVVTQLLKLSEKRYKENKENVDLINLKVHDLKHQINLNAQKRNLSQDAIDEMTNIINIYDSKMNTENEVIDVILKEKSLLCQKNNIVLKCFADCSKLIFISESDLYSLFGNAIDNAIEAVNNITNVDKRKINFSVKNVNSFVSITFKNYFDGSIEMDHNGFPITTKDNKFDHGYGIKSINMIVKKYNGDMKISINKDIFTLSILFNIKNI